MLKVCPTSERASDVKRHTSANAGDKDDREFIASVVPILSCNKSTSYAKSWNAR